jgi:lysophospholipase L1-like esterase
VTQARSSRGRLVNAAVVVVTLFLALGAVEAVLRTWYPVRGAIYQLDDRYLYRHIPGSRRLSGGSVPGVFVQINDAGRRGDESGLARGARRVAVYGDSYIAAEYTPDSQTFAAVLERLLTDKLGPTEVLNAGVTGYGPDQIALRLADELPALKPELVIVAIYAGNDFGDLLRNKLFRLDERGTLVRNAPVVDASLRRQFEEPLSWSSIQIVRAVQSLAQRWRSQPPAGPPGPPPERTARRLANRLDEYDSYIVRGDNEVHNLLADEYDADVSLEPESAAARYRIGLLTRVFERIRETTDAAGARLLVLVIPEFCDIGGPCDEVATRKQHPAYREAGLTDAVGLVARHTGLTYLNLFEPFRNAGAIGLYHPADQHWNAAGQELAARLASDAIVSGGLLKGPTRAGTY